MTDRPSHAPQTPPPPRPRRETAPSDPALSESLAHPPTSRRLWDIAHPLEVAHSILVFYADPMRELRRRERFARRQKNPEENIRFWAEVEVCIRLSAPHPGRTP